MGSGAGRGTVSGFDSESTMVGGGASVDSAPVDTPTPEEGAGVGESTSSNSKVGCEDSDGGGGGGTGNVGGSGIVSIVPVA